MPYKNKKIILNGKAYIPKSISQIEEEIECISTIKAVTEKETLELKIKAIKSLPQRIDDKGIKYRKHVNLSKLEVYYEMI